MKRFSAGLVLMLLCTFSIFAQNKVITVSGRVVESDTKGPQRRLQFNCYHYLIVLMPPV